MTRNRSSFRPFNSAPTLKATALVALLLFTTMTVAVPAWSQDSAPPPAVSSSEDTSQGTASGAGMQAASAVATILYFPFKAAFAIGGGIVGGLAYVFSGGSDTTAKNIWTTSMYGTYIITPEHLTGDRAVRFLGVPADSTTETMPQENPQPEGLDSLK